MTAAILSAGPSLSATWHGDAYATSYAINRAILTVPEYDWLCCGDWHAGTFLWGHARPRVGMLSMRLGLDAALGMRDAGAEVSCSQYVAWETIQEKHFQGNCNYTLCATILLIICEHGHREVDIYGCDWSGAEHCDGSKDPKRLRSQNGFSTQWEQERSEVLDILDMIRGKTSHPLRVRRVLPFGSEEL